MSDYLIVISFNTAGIGTTKPTLKNYLNGADIPDPLPLIPGDRVAFNVQLNAGFQKRQLSYQVDFIDPATNQPNETFLGVSTIDVPNGGTSPFFHVLPLTETVKYSVTVPGLGTILDPEMQTGQGVRPAIDAAGIRTYLITWDIDLNTVVYQQNGGPATPFPPPPGSLPLNLNDTVAFNATAAAGAPPGRRRRRPCRRISRRAASRPAR